MSDNGSASAPTTVSLLYGEPKRAKTSAGLAAFPGALWVGVESAIRSVAEAEYGYTPAVYPSEVSTLPELLALILDLTGSNALTDFDALCIDDLTLICLMSIAMWKREGRTGRSGKADNFYPYTQLDDHLVMLADACRHAGIHGYLVAHERLPGSNSKDQFVPGGPSLGSGAQATRIPAWCDRALRAVLAASPLDPWLGTEWYCRPFDRQWVTGDRDSVATIHTPPNLREMMRAGPTSCALRRLPGLEWQDSVADYAAEAMVGGRDGVGAASKAPAGADPRHVRWAVQDGIARGRFIRQKEARFDFFSGPPAGATPPRPTPPAPPKT